MIIRKKHRKRKTIENPINETKEKTKNYKRKTISKAQRERILSRDQHKCCCCGLGIEDEPHLLLEIDHIVPVSLGGTNDDDNLQTLCWMCNRSKHTKVIDYKHKVIEKTIERKERVKMKEKTEWDLFKEKHYKMNFSFVDKSDNTLEKFLKK